jgi:hypothetical protein
MCCYGFDVMCSPIKSFKEVVAAACRTSSPEGAWSENSCQLFDLPSRNSEFKPWGLNLNAQETQQVQVSGPSLPL